MPPKPKPKPPAPPPPEPLPATIAAKFQQLDERITRLEELIMGAIVHASDLNPPAPSNR
jgi:hypothetical protein